MPIVGEAIVRLRLTSDQLGNDIRNAVRDAVRGINGDLDRQGNSVGRRFSNGIGNGVRGSENDLRRDGERASTALRDGFERDHRRNTAPRLLAAFGKLGGDLGKEFNLGIGAARMGQAVISGLLLAGPSIISGFGAILTSLASEIITFGAAVGPGLAGAVGVGLAAVSTLGLNLGLLKLAFSGNTQQAKDFKAQFNNFKETLTEAFAPGVLSGFSDAVKILKDQLLPEVNGLLKDTGVAMGDIARNIANTVTSSANLNRIKGILATNKTFLDNFNVGIGGLTTSFIILFNAAKPFVDFIGEGIKKFGEWASATLTANEANGSLAAFMDRMLQNFKDFWNLIKLIGTGIGNVFKGAAPAGKDLFESMTGVAQKFADWTGKPENMKRMEDFFLKAHEITSGIFSLLGKIFAAGGRAFEGVDTGKIQHFFDTLERVGESIGQIFSQIKEAAGGNLAGIFDDLATIMENLAASGAVGNVAGAFSSLAKSLTDVLTTISANPIGAKVLGYALAFALFGGIIKALFISPLIAIGTALGGLSAAAAAVVGAIAAVIGFFILMWQNSEKLRSAIGDQLQPTLETFKNIWDTIAPKIQPAWEALNRLAGVIGDRLAPIIRALWPTVLLVFTVIGNIIGFWLDFITGLFTIFSDVLSGDWEHLWTDILTFLNTIFGDIGLVFQSVWNVLWAVAIQPVIDFNDYLTSILGPMPEFAATVWNDFYAATIQPLQDLWNEGMRILGEFFDWIVGLLLQAPGFARDVWNDFYAATIQPLQDLWNEGMRIIGGLIDWIAETIGRAPGFARDVWNDFYRDTIQPVQDLYNDVTRVVGEMIDWVVDHLANIPWPDIGGFLYDHIVQPFIDTWNNITDFVGRITGAITSLGAANSALAAAKADNANLTGSGAAGGAAFGGSSLLGRARDAIEGAMRIQVTPFAIGGIVNQPTLALVGEAGRERVDPIMANGLTARDMAIITALMGQFANATGGTSGDVNVYLGTERISQFVERVVDQRESALARRVAGRRAR